MQQQSYQIETNRYAKCVEVSKRIRWDIDTDLIRGRQIDFGHKFLPDGLSLIHELDFLSGEEQRLLSQIQGRSYANIFGLVERFINAKVLEVSRDHWLGDQTALEALIRFNVLQRGLSLITPTILTKRLNSLAAQGRRRLFHDQCSHHGGYLDGGYDLPQGHHYRRAHGRRPQGADSGHSRLAGQQHFRRHSFGQRDLSGEFSPEYPASHSRPKRSTRRLAHATARRFPRAEAFQPARSG